MSDYQQDQAGWEWQDFDNKRWLAEQDDTEQQSEPHIMDQLLAQFDSVFTKNKDK